MEWQAYRNTRVATLFQSSQILPRVLIETIAIVFSVLFISLSQILLRQNIQDFTGVLGVFAVASIRLLPASSQCIQSLNQMRKGSHTLNLLYLDLREIEKEKIDDYLHPLANLRNTKTPFKKITSQAVAFKARVELNKVSYQYPGASGKAIDNITLSIKKANPLL